MCLLSIEFSIDIHGPLQMISNHFGYIFTFSLVPSGSEFIFVTFAGQEHHHKVNISFVHKKYQNLDE